MTRLRRFGRAAIPALAFAVAGGSSGQPAAAPIPGSNPIIRDRFTADPAPLVVGDRLYLYVGHDEADDGEMFNMREWLAYSTTDMRHWTAHGAIMRATDFRWAIRDAWASQVIERNGRFWFYAAVEHDATHPGKAIGVAVSDSPTGPFVDARGSALITNEMTPRGTHSWEDIDPTVLTDVDGTTWIAWGNRNCYLARLKPNMTEIDGPIMEITPPHSVIPRMLRTGRPVRCSNVSASSVGSGEPPVSRQRTERSCACSNGTPRMLAMTVGTAASSVVRLCSTMRQ